MKKFRLRISVAIVLSFVVAAAIGVPAQTLTTIYNFCSQSSCADGLNPSRLLLAGDGNFYGTTVQGGTHGAGSVFKITPSGTLTTLHSFNGSDGLNPYVGVVPGNDGNFYGTTTNGGYHSIGEVFKITPGGTLTVLHFFNYTYGDGGYPGGLVLGRDGNLYGTTSLGGGQNKGTFYVVSRDGSTFATQYGFESSVGSNPTAALVVGSDGNFYGVAGAGGAHASGSVFKITPGGTPTLLYSFCSQLNCTDGASPSSSLLLASDGNFYGMTYGGGDNQFGTVFKITPSGAMTKLHSFNRTDGRNALGALIQAHDGNFYGTTAAGGTHDVGTIFQMTPAGVLTSLYSFKTSDGSGPSSGLVQGNDGKFYGTTSAGGVNNDGTIFKLDPTFSTLIVSTIGAGTVTSTDGFINCPGTCNHAYPNNTPVTLNATPSGGWSFSGWSGACTGMGSCHVTMSQNQSVTASFTQLSYSLTVSTSGQGSVISSDGYINCPGTCNHTYLSNTVVTLNANPALGWSFTGWSGDCTGTGSCHLVMDQDLSVAAAFRPASYVQLTSSPNPSTVGQQVTMTATIGPSGPPTPTGTVSFTSNAVAIAGCTSVPLVSQIAHCVTSSLAVGTDAIVATYSGDSNYLGSSGTLVQIVNPVPTPVKFVAITPCRIVDTRNPNGTFGGPILSGHSVRNFPLSQPGNPCDIPASAVAYSVNVAVVPSGALNYLTIWPAGQGQPYVATLNSLDGRVKSNAAIVSAGTPSGAVSVYATNTTHVILDINGYFTSSSDSSLVFYPLTPCRVVDTRDDNLPSGLGSPHLENREVRDLPFLASSCLNGIDNPRAYSINIAVVPNPSGTRLNYLTVWPSDQPQPLVANLNNPTATVVANAAIVPAAANGNIKVFAYNSTDVIMDINGYFAEPGQGGLSFYAVTPCRVYDSRVNNGQPFRGTRAIPVSGSPCAPPASAGAYVFNATVVPSGVMPYLTLWPDPEQKPFVATLNAYDGYVTSNMAIVPNENGITDAYTDALTHLILDIAGYFAQ